MPSLGTQASRPGDRVQFRTSGGSVQWLLERLGTGDPEALAAQLMILAEGASATETLLAAAGVFAQAAK